MFHLIVPHAPAYPTPTSSTNLAGSLNNLANERAPSPDLLPRNTPRLAMMPLTSIQVADYTGKFC